MARTKRGRLEGQIDGHEASTKLLQKWGTNGVDAGYGTADWSEINPHLVLSLVAAVGALRGAVMLGVDKNGSGFTLNIFLGGKKVLNKWWLCSAEGVEQLHTDVEGFVIDLHEAAP